MPIYLALINYLLSYYLLFLLKNNFCFSNYIRNPFFLYLHNIFDFYNTLYYIFANNSFF